MSIFLLAASSRKESINKKLIQLCEKILINKKVKCDRADFQEFDMPLYDGDLEESSGIPQGAQAFIARLQANQAMILASPEYNFSTPGTLKNLIDWVSRARPMPWSKRKIMLISASPALVGGNRGLWHTRVPLEACGAFVYPDMFSLASAYDAFDTQGQLKDQGLQQRLEGLLESFAAW